MKQAFTSLTLDGLKFNSIELLKLCRQKSEDVYVPQWQKDIYSFILNWLDRSDHIEISTSGSTGTPKRIKLKKQWMINSASQTCEFFNIDKTSTALICLPAAYIAGKMMITRAFVSQCNLLTAEPKASPFGETDRQIDFSAVTPYQLYHTFKDPGIGNNIKTLIVGGGEISASLEKSIMEVPADIYATYGMTETCSHIALRRINGPDSTSWFTVLGNTRISQDIRSCMIIEAPELNDQILTTNDIVEIKDDRHFRWLGRWDNVINSGGIKIIPEKIEKIISSIRHERSVIVPLPDERLGSVPVLVIESEDIDASEVEELFTHLSAFTDKYSQPKKIITLPAFPETPTGKPDRRKIVGLITRF
jgi:o-succinylbenzoate---CoA ligase